MKKQLLGMLILFFGNQLYSQYISQQPLPKYSYCISATPSQTNVDISVGLISPLPSGGVMLEWQRQNGNGSWTTIASVAGAIGTNIRTVNAGTYRVIANPNTSGLTSDTSDVTVVFAVSNEPAIFISSSGVLNCENSSVNLSINNSGETITSTVWTFNSNPYSNLLSEIISVQNAGTYAVTASNACGDSFDQETVTSNTQAPSNISFSPEMPVLLCSLGMVEITIQVTPNNSTATWDPPPGATVTFIPPQNTLKASVNKTGMYDVTLAHPISKCTTSTSITVAPGSDFPSANIASPEKITCLKPTVMLTATLLNNPDMAQWYRGNTPINPAGAIVTVSQGGAYKLVLKKGTCENEIPITVEEDKATPQIDLPASAGFCEGGSITLKAELLGGVSASDFSFEWSGTPTVTSQEKTVQIGGKYLVTVTKNSNGCKAVDSINVVEIEKPVLSNIVTPLTFQSGSFVPITFGPDIQPNDATLSWTVLQSSNVNMNTNQFNGSGKITRTFLLGGETRTIGAVLYSFVPKNQGCIGDSAIVEINVLPSISSDADPFIPEIYTPNGDGQNDIWQVALPTGAEGGDYAIYNRLGGKVMDGNVLTTPWDGSGCPDGTYFYVLRYNVDGTEVVKKGAVTILRTTD